MNSTVVITGASSGFGRLTALRFAAAGWHVVGSMRRPDTCPPELIDAGIQRVALDVTDPSSVTAAVDAVVDTTGRIDVLVNNAGHGGHGMFEAFTDAEVRAMFETNFFGALSVTRSVLPVMRKQQSGTIVNITSIAGMVSGATSGVYAATKFALEAITESMASEYAPLGVRIRSVAPGAFHTGFRGANRDGTSPLSGEFATYAETLRTTLDARIEAMYDGAPDPTMVAETVFEVATGDTTTIRTPVGPDAVAVATSLHSMPRQDFLDQMGR
ncbi:MAG: SDR family oxidoreductase [Actinomycetota bacterium]